MQTGLRSGIQGGGSISTTNVANNLRFGIKYCNNIFSDDLNWYSVYGNIPKCDHSIFRKSKIDNPASAYKDTLGDGARRVGRQD